jgi:hypothetical protein
LVLRVNVRDLPRGLGDKSGARIHELPESGMWRDFTKWAWNENWVAIESARSLVPSGSGAEEVDTALVRKVFREVLVDNVRGQAPEWRDEEMLVAPFVTERAYLERKSLVLEVWNEYDEYDENGTRDELLGRGLLHLGAACASAGRPFAFQAPMAFDDEPCGWLAGQAQIHFI